MDLLSILLIGVGLSMDCLAVAIAGSMSRQSPSHVRVLRLSLSFGLFQAGMLVLGWVAGRTIVEIIETYDHWVAFGLLSLVGARMIWESFRAEDHKAQRTDITKGIALLTLSLATSIDALAVGLSLAFLESRILLAAPVIGSITFLITGAGFYIGREVGSRLGRWAEILGGLVLIGIGLRIVLTHIP